MPLLVRAFPLRVPVAEVEAFAAQLVARGAETDAFFRQFGVSHESWHVQDTPAGAWLIGVTKVRDPAEAGPRYASSSGEFDSWFKSEVSRMSEFDPTQQPLGAQTQHVFTWSDPRLPDSDLCA